MRGHQFIHYEKKKTFAYNVEKNRNSCFNFIERNSTFGTKEVNINETETHETNKIQKREHKTAQVSLECFKRQRIVSLSIGIRKHTEAKINF